MAVTTGIDLQIVDEISDSLDTFGDRYLRRIYSEREILECAVNPASMARALAFRFAAKEAVLKVLAPHDHIPPWRSIEILLQLNAPAVVLHGEAETLARQRGIEEILVSVSFARGQAIAVAVADASKKVVRLPKNDHEEFQSKVVQKEL